MYLICWFICLVVCLVAVCYDFGVTVGWFVLVGLFWLVVSVNVVFVCRGAFICLVMLLLVFAWLTCGVRVVLNVLRF